MVGFLQNGLDSLLFRLLMDVFAFELVVFVWELTWATNTETNINKIECLNDIISDLKLKIDSTNFVCIYI